ncbi:MAG TPA: HD domain-containing phosphohydrolase [Polyangiaceae bacterium]|jgi:putative nucleotidyltransferase with HDIG domain
MVRVKERKVGRESRSPKDHGQRGSGVIQIPRAADPAVLIRAEARRVSARLVRAVAGRGPESEAHCERIAIWSRRLASDLGLPSERVLDIELGGLLHDIGYLTIPSVNLDRRGPLTAEERKTLRWHSEVGAALIDEIPALRRAVSLVAAHHEDYDGRGYPYGLSGTGISIGARILRLVDTYEALTHDRPHRPRLSDRDARLEIARGVGRSFDPLVHAAFSLIDPEVWSGLVAAFP